MSSAGGVFGIVGLISRFLNVPIGAGLRKAGGAREREKYLAKHELINSVMGITVDDICMGNSPFYAQNADKLRRESGKKLENLTKEINSISKWAAFDLLSLGYSVYSVKVKNNHLYLLPETDELEFYLTDEKRVIVFKEKKELRGAVVFINYNKASLEIIPDNKLTEQKEEDKRDFEAQGKDKKSESANKEVLKYTIKPTAIQVANIDASIKELQLIERAIQRYRRDARILRFITVDVGMSQGDKIDEVTESIGNGLNADSISLEEATLSDYFNDEMPVFPTKGGKGKPELTTDIPDFNIKEMMDLDHVLSKIFLGMRFPKSYADFSTTLDATAVSMIRGDIRYSRLIKQVRSLMEDTVNAYLEGIEVLKNKDVKLKLTEMPTPEEEEVVNSLTLYSDFSSEFYEFVINTSETKGQAEHKVDMLECLLGNSTSLLSVSKWLAAVRACIDDKFSEAPDVQQSEDELGESAGADFGSGGPDQPSDLSEFEVPGSEAGGPGEEAPEEATSEAPVE